MPARVLKVDVSQTIAGLGKMRADQIPYATALFLTRLAYEIKDAETNEIQRVFDRPTPWTIQSVWAKPATKQQLVSWVGLKDDASKGVPASRYLAAEVFGGARHEKRSERALEYKGLLTEGQFIAPAKGITLDAYGNVPKGTMTKILSALRASADSLQNRSLVNAMTRSAAKNLKLKRRGQLTEYFVGRPGAGRLPLGIWLRRGRKIVPLLLVIARPNYRVRFQFFDVAEAVALKRSHAIFLESWQRALAGARPE